MPGWQPRRIECKTCLPGNCAAEGFATCQDRGVFGPKTKCFSQFLKVFSFQLTAVKESADVVSYKTCFLESELCGAGEYRTGIRIMRHIAKDKDVRMPYCL